MGKVVRPEMKYPNMRNEFIGYLNSLSNKEYQESVWVRGESYPGVVHDELDYAIHFIYDDTTLAADPSSAIGLFLRDQAEAQSVRDLVSALNVVFSRYGLNLSDQEYINKPEWEGVIRYARICKELLLS